MRYRDAHRAVNIIDVRQSHPQMMMRIAFESIGKKEIAENIRHVAYGEVELESGGLSGRKGNWMGYSADEILAEATTRVEEAHNGQVRFRRCGKGKGCKGGRAGRDKVRVPEVRDREEDSILMGQGAQLRERVRALPPVHARQGEPDTGGRGGDKAKARHIRNRRL